MRIASTVLGGVVVALFAAGYVLFALHVTSMIAREDVHADGIVVLTGGRERVAGAVDLLDKGKAQRLLISGVHPSTTARQIMQLTAGRQALFTCCIDLDRRAKNTIGNATETAKWAARNSFKSLIVVTSAYHMPRGILELRAAMPQMTFIPYPVFAADLNLPHWYAHVGTVRLLMREYVKYIVAWLRDGIAPERAHPTTVSASTGNR